MIILLDYFCLNFYAELLGKCQRIVKNFFIPAISVISPFPYIARYRAGNICFTALNLYNLKGEMIIPRRCGRSPT